MKLKILLFVLLLQGTALFAFSQTSIWNKMPVSTEGVNARLENYASEYESYAPIPRFAIFDIGYPMSVEEYNKLDGNAVFMITGLTQKENMLPFKKIYASVGGKEVELTLIKSVLSKNDDAKSQVVKVFGSYRVDALYLMPVYLRFRPASVMALFSNDEERGPLLIAGFDGPKPAAISMLPDKEPTGKGPDKASLDTFLRREYPAFFADEKPVKKN
jgi:hypothetical protein